MSDFAIPAGFHKGRIIAGSEQFGTTKNGTDQIVLDVDLTDLRRQVSVVLFFSEKAAPYALEKLRACGWTGDDVTQLSGIDANEITVVVKYEVFEGKERLRADIATTGGRITLESPMDAPAKRGFAARMKAAAKTVPRATPVQSQKRPAAPETDEDDVPF